MGESTTFLTQVVLPLGLAFIMFSMGLALTLADFKRVAVQPRDFLVGAVGQVVLLPAIAFALVSFWPMDPELAVGIMILSACPGGVTSNLLSHLAKGDTALSISLTAVISVVAVVTLPFIVGFAFDRFMPVDRNLSIDIGGTMLGVFLITTVPVALGMLVKHFASGFADKVERGARIAATILFVLIVLGAIYSARENIVDYFAQAGPATLALNVIMMLVGLGLAGLFRLGEKQGIAISLECGLQNSTLAIFVAGTLLDNLEMTIPGAIYGLLMFATAGAFIAIVLRRARRVAAG